MSPMRLFTRARSSSSNPRERLSSSLSKCEGASDIPPEPRRCASTAGDESRTDESSELVSIEAQMEVLEAVAKSCADLYRGQGGACTCEVRGTEFNTIQRPKERDYFLIIRFGNRRISVDHELHVLFHPIWSIADLFVPDDQAHADSLIPWNEVIE